MRWIIAGTLRSSRRKTWYNERTARGIHFGARSTLEPRWNIRATDIMSYEFRVAQVSDLWLSAVYFEGISGFQFFTSPHLVALSFFYVSASYCVECVIRLARLGTMYSNSRAMAMSLVTCPCSLLQSTSYLPYSLVLRPQPLKARQTAGYQTRFLFEPFLIL